MRMHRRGSYVRNATDAVDRECDHCEWYGVASSYPKLIKRYQDHLRDEHPRVWLRS
ncbi:hypothetical protein Halxa_0854 [Halopiger xanaduensis SH-6]|uniref:Uncharacterized protein n=2 Tax=Halopiger xanaduensis TaxID=387343 RepID=F8D7P5_HALXS|nr:hypothetical protein Halxa_0854 [Halopiger xanaduensis SH-6]